MTNWQRITRAMSLLIVVFLTAISLSGPTHTAFAQDSSDSLPKFGLSPTDAQGNYFDLSMMPGEVRQIEALVTNSADVGGVAFIYSSDTYTIVNGGMGVRLADDPKIGTGLWIDISDSEISLDANSETTISLTVAIPENVSPGQHLAGLAIQSLSQGVNNTGDGISLKNVTRQAIAVLITIPGPVSPAIEIGSVFHKTVATSSILGFDVGNPGNIMWKAAGELSLSTAEGTEIETFPITLGTVYAGDESRLETSIGYHLEPGDYLVSLYLVNETYNLRAESGSLPLHVPEPPEGSPANPATEDEDEDENRTVIETQIVGIPTWMLLIAIPLAILIGAAIAFLALKRRMQQTMLASGVAQPQVVAQQRPAPNSKPVNVRKMTPPTRGPNTNHENNEE